MYPKVKLKTYMNNILSPRRKVRCTTPPARSPNLSCTKRKQRRWSSGSDTGSPCSSPIRRTNEKIPEGSYTYTILTNLVR